MKSLLQFTTKEGYDFFVELPDENIPNEPVRGFLTEDNKQRIIQDAIVNFEKSLEPLKSISNSIFNSVKEIADSPDEINVELGLKFSAKAGLILTSLDGEANLKITLKWNKLEAEK